jgi:hypothetical protein
MPTNVHPKIWPRPSALFFFQKAVNKKHRMKRKSQSRSSKVLKSRKSRLHGARSKSRYATQTTYSETFGLPLTTLKAGSILYTGQSTFPQEPIFLTPHKSLAKMYASTKPNGGVFRVQVMRNRTLVPKIFARYFLKPRNDPGEWEGFGSPTPDYSVGRSVCRKAKSHTLGVHGWIHDVANPTFGEIFLCTCDDLRLL